MNVQTQAPVPEEDSRPHSIEAEQQFLGALLTENARLSWDGVRIKADRFYDPFHSRIYQHICDQVDAGKIATATTAHVAFMNDAALAQVGGKQYLIRLVTASIASNAVREYAQMISDLAEKRDLQEIMLNASEAIKEGLAPANQIASELETATGQILADTESKPLVRSHLSGLSGALKQVSDAYRGETPVGVSTGLPALDKELAFMRSGNLIVLAGRPAMGKTSVAQNFAYHAASNRTGVFFASLEMSTEELTTRFVSRGLEDAGHKISYSRMLRGKISEQEMRAVMQEMKRQEAFPQITGERDVRTLSRLRSAARRAQQVLAKGSTPLGLIIVDYVQRCDTDRPVKSIYERVTKVTDALKSMAMDFGVPVVALAQLNRGVEMRDNKRPLLSDLKESGSLEEDADVVLFCYRHVYYLQQELRAVKTDEERADIEAAILHSQHEIELIIGKQRSGATSTVNAFFQPGTCYLSANNPGALV